MPSATMLLVRLSAALVLSCGIALPAYHPAPQRSALAALGGATGRPAARAQAQTLPTIDRAQLLDDMRTLSSDAMEGREAGTAGGLKARQFVVSRFRAVGLQPFPGGYEQPFAYVVNGRRVEAANVIGSLPAGSATSGRHLVISAHYDHIGVHGGEIFNGADDNASGTAALFAIAAYFRQHPPVHALTLAAFDAEEAGLRGSRAFLAMPPVPKASIALNLNVDMIGRDAHDTLYVVGTRVQPALGQVIDRVAATASIRLVRGHDDPRVGDDWTRDSDQYSFMQAGIPALYFGVEDYAQHHRATDDAETMTVDFYERAVETIVDVVRAFDARLDAVAGAQPSTPARVN